MSSHRVCFRGARQSLITLCVVLWLAFADCSSLHGQQSGVALVFLAEPATDAGLWPVLFDSLREDLAVGIGELPEGVALDPNPLLLRAEDFHESQKGSLIEVKLLGRCDVLPQAAQPWRRASDGPLGWVERVSGEIQPIIFIDCGRLAEVLRPATAGMNSLERRQAMIQAVAHVLIHEWIHVTTQSASHSAHGIARASLSARELIAGPPQEYVRLANK